MGGYERSTLDKVLNLSLPLETLSRFESTFQGLAYQSEYCSFHYEEFLKSCEKHELAMMGKLEPLQQSARGRSEFCVS